MSSNIRGLPIVAVFDSGVGRHPALAAALVPGIDLDAGAGGNDDRSESGHATHVAGIIAAKDIGFAAGHALIMSVSGMYSQNSNLLDQFERGVAFVIDQKTSGKNIRVVNASFGIDCDNEAEKRRWAEAGRKLGQHDILLVAAADNRTTDHDDGVHMPAALELSNVLTVTALDRANDKLLPSASYGRRTVDLGTTGEGILSTLPWDEKLGRMTGASQAAPIASAAAALLFESAPQLTAEGAREILLGTADTDQDVSDRIASGKLNIGRALERVGSHIPESVRVAREINAAPQSGDVYAYSVRGGDELEALAERFRTTAAEIERANSEAVRCFGPGARLLIPSLSTHVVEEPDLERIAQALNESYTSEGTITAADLRSINGIAASTSVRVGEILAFEKGKAGTPSE